MRVFVGSVLPMLLVSAAHAQEGAPKAMTPEMEMIITAKTWRDCVVSSSEKIAVKSKQTPEDIVSAFIDDCHYPEIVALLEKSFEKDGQPADPELVNFGAQRLFGGERRSIAAEARQAIVKARIEAGL